MNRVEGKAALVTGGAAGLGRAIAELLVIEGAVVTITDINATEGKKAANEIGAVFIHQDVRDERTWEDTIAATMDYHGRMDILVNNAGIAEAVGPGDPEATTVDAWDNMFSVNARGVFLGCKHAIPAMRDTGGGSIVNMSSIAALVATPFITAYGASKAAVRQLTMSVAAHCADNKFNIRCNSVHPGQIQTGMLEGLFDKVAGQAGLDKALVRNDFRERIPLGEFGEPKDIAYAVLYLASDESKHVTGTQLVVDGGMNMNS